jgi:hypothetical protein
MLLLLFDAMSFFAVTEGKKTLCLTFSHIKQNKHMQRATSPAFIFSNG